jgi:hypothetical protein
VSRQPRNDDLEPASVNAFGTEIERDERGWCVTKMVDGARRVVSRHSRRDQAEAASNYLNASANRSDRDAQP